MKNKIMKVLGVVMAVAMIASFMVAGSPVSAAGSAATINEWEKMTLPNLVPNSDVELIEQANDGTIFISVLQYFPGTFTAVAGSNNFNWEIIDEYTMKLTDGVITGTWSATAGTSNLVYPVTITGHDGTTTFFLKGTLTVAAGTSNATLELEGTQVQDASTYTVAMIGDTGTGDTSAATFYFNYSDAGTTESDGEVYISGLTIHIDAGGDVPEITLGAVTAVFDLLQANSMYKSTDGYTWDKTNIYNKAERITAIEPSANYAVDKTVYVAIDTQGLGYTTLYRCTNAASVGTPVGEMGMISAGMGASLNATYIYDLDSYYDGSYVWLLAATDIDVFAIRDDRGLTTIWTDMQLSETLGGEYSDYFGTPTGVTVFKAMFAADYASTGVVWAIYFDEYASPALATRFPALTGNTDGYGIIARSSGSTLWGTIITPVIISESGNQDARPECDFEFSAAYSSATNPELYAALSFWGNNPEDDIYRIECGFYGAAGNITPFDVDPTGRIDFCSIEVDGNNIIVGSFDQSYTATEVWYSTDNGTSWAMSARNPTGNAFYTCNLLISKFGSTDGMAFAATGGTQSAVSISDDYGLTWAQIAFIDDDIAIIVDMAFNPTSTAAFLVTTNAAWDDSLWMTSNVNTPVVNWKRLYCENYNTDIDMTMVEYSDDGAAVMIWDRWSDVIYRSTDGAKTFASWRNTASWGTINAWLIPNASTVYAATDTGFWSTALVGSRLPAETLVSIAKFGDTLAVGNTTGSVFISINKGNTWGAANTIAGSGTVYVAFDSKGVLYFATETGNEVYSVVLKADGTFTTTGPGVLTDMNVAYLDDLVGIRISADDTIFVLDDDGDASRYLLYDINATEWDGVENTLAGSTDELWVTQGSNVAWTIDNSNDWVWLCDDTLSSPVSGITVTNIGPFSATIGWNNMTGAEVYELLFVEYDALGLVNDTATAYVAAQTGTRTVIDTSALVPVIPSLYDSTDYDVFVRVNNGTVIPIPLMPVNTPIATEVELSRWGMASFMTKYYMETPKPTNPIQGTDGTTLNPTFGWSSVPNAVSYTFQLSSKPDFSTLIDTASLSVTGYTYAGDALDYSTAYYWRVKAIGPDATESKWSTYTPAYMSITLEEFLAGWDVDDVMGFFRNGDMVFYWTTGAISSFNTMVNPDEYQSSLTITQTIPTITITNTQTNPTYTIPVPEFTVTVPAAQTTVTTITNEVVIPTKETPAYIWAIVAIGALLTIAVIVLIIRTRRVV